MVPRPPSSRTLLFLRHAKSSWDDPALDDFDRPLAPRGRRDAPRMGAWLRDEGLAPDVVVCSPAARTRETWAAVAAPLADPPAPDFPRALYPGDPDAILSLVRALPDDAATALVIGHNPGLADAIRALAGRDGDGPEAERRGGAPAEERRRLWKKVPTAALAVFAVDGGWRDVAPGRARLERFVRPKDLG